MDIQYFKSAWGDIKNSPRWFGRMCLLALLNFIPIFGQIVTFGYLYGWAREIAWGTHEPMPAKIFANEDGKFWRRGWFVLVLTFVFALVPYIIVLIGNALQGLGMASTFFGREYVENPAWIGIGGVVELIGVVGMVFTGVLAWIGSMRIAIYDRLSAGFQLGKIWTMLRRDTGGIVRIFGMNILVSLILGIVLSILCFILTFIVVAMGVAGLMSAGYSPDMFQYMTNAQAMRMIAQFVVSAGFVGVLSIFIVCFATSLVTMFVNALVIRAVGYWTMQFDVPRWGGQDDPLPFELFNEEPAVQQQAPQPQAQQQAPMGGAGAYSPAGQPTRPASQATPGAPAVVAPIFTPTGDVANSPSGDVEVDYGGPAVVGAEFLMKPEEIDELEAEVRAQITETAESEVQGAHGIEYGQASNPDVGEYGQPHVGNPEGGERED